MTDFPRLQLGTGSVTSVDGARVLAIPTRPVDVTAAEDGNGTGHDEGDGPPLPRAIAGPGSDHVAAAYGIDIPTLLVRERAKGEAGEVLSYPLLGPGGDAEHLLLVGTGDGSPLAMRRAGAALARRVRGKGQVATTVVYEADDAALRAFADGFLLGSYRFSRRSTAPNDAPPERVDVLVARPALRGAALARAVTTARAVWLARDLANTPANEKSPHWLAARAQEVARESGVVCRVWDEDALGADGFGGILAVGMGSARPPRLIELSYEPADTDAATPHVVLVGKGIVFDSGGLSLKPREAMIPMKMDMAGGGAVIAVLSALRDLGVRVRVTGLIAAAENAPSGSAQRPGDVIRQYGGTTVEVFNTDAEGRLVLADALAYADRNLDPDALVDIATLTGAATQGLGKRHAALYATDDRLCAELLTAGADTGEQVWRMPLVEDYRGSLDSTIADLANISRDPTISGGSITAALFLREFTGGRPWAHLDIAGPGKVDFEEHEITKGGTGYGTRLLLRWLEDAPSRRRSPSR